MPTPVRVVHCPACRRERVARLIGTATINGRRMPLAQCPDDTCELIWAVRSNPQPAAA